ncbi:MAG: Stp1/IreP family PP2C-type Ser/Thr phosphatase [Chitinophagaceae bacterium]|nr:MAG: Stp1/IreP family PP2C-type Ser/Thr phosphatase [Chitinophagaceae bacterium]
MWSKWFGKKKVAGQAVSSGAPQADVQLNVVILSDLGMIRTNNEDMGWFVRNSSEEIIRQKGYLLVVADGMGGHQAGEVASNLAAETVSEVYFHSGDKTGIEKSLDKAFRSANEKIYSLSSSDAAYRGMGTTCTAIAIVGNQIFYGHAGDSRAYLIKKGVVTQVTEDHTYVQELVKAGEITHAEAARHPKRNILTNAMGTKPSLRVDTGRHAGEFGFHDRILLCSDGLYDYIADNELAEILDGRSLQDAAETMVNEAKRRGGHDNITVVIAEKLNPSAPAATRETRDIKIPQSIQAPQTKETELP